MPPVGLLLLLVPVWVGLVVLMMATDLDPMGSWLGIPFGLTLILASAHLAYFRGEHSEISRRFSPRTPRPELIVPLLVAGLRSL